MDTARFAKLILCVMPQRGTGCSLISGLVMQAEACGPWWNSPRTSSSRPRAF